jgi:hypothetical protein
MNTDQRMAGLPRAYSLALRLESLGADAVLIADCLDIEVEGVGPLLRIARQKLADMTHPGKEEK